jgi:hypothetical protein
MRYGASRAQGVVKASGGKLVMTRGCHGCLRAACWLLYIEQPLATRVIDSSEILIDQQPLRVRGTMVGGQDE